MWIKILDFANKRGITKEAVMNRIHRGTLKGKKVKVVKEEWVVWDSEVVKHNIANATKYGRPKRTN